MVPKEPDYNPGKPRELKAQIAISCVLGLSALLTFCILRTRWPQVYMARTRHRRGLPLMSKSLFGWLISLYSITESDILEHAGLDAYVFLGFFRMAIQLLSIFFVLGVTVISPVRYYYTGRYDQDEDNDFFDVATLMKVGKGDDDGSSGDNYEAYLWVYVVFSYLFTIITVFFLLRQTERIIRVRQKYLGHQNAITDRTLRLAGIPKHLRTEASLKEHIESLNIGLVREVHFCCNWEVLDSLFSKRQHLLRKLEVAWTRYLGPTWIDAYNQQYTPEYISLSPTDDEDSSAEPSITLPAPERSGRRHPIRSHPRARRASLQLSPVIGAGGFHRPMERAGFLGLFGEKYDVIDHYTQQLEELDATIEDLRSTDPFEPLHHAFITMDSVASAQMMAQAVLDPRAFHLLALSAPSPRDVIWTNVYMSENERVIRSYTITLLIAVMTVLMVVPVLYLASFLQWKTINKLWPWLGTALKNHDNLNTFVTGILPPLFYTLMTSVLPYLYVYLSYCQGFVSHGEVELAAISKNFFFVFFNMFLVFTAAGTFSNVWSFIKDTTQLAYELAKSLRRLSSFYTDLIILQGLGMSTFRLLQFGSIMKISLFSMSRETPRDFRNLYKPGVFNYGIMLPQPILILIIVILYSAISTKILFFGTLYFVCGYFTYKYQLMYSMVHPPHSSGQMWQIIFRRVCFGLILFHLSMVGMLAAAKGYLLASMLTPLPFGVCILWYNFEYAYVPLLKFIALRAIETNSTNRAPVIPVVENTDIDSDEDEQDEESSLIAPSGSFLRQPSRTLDEARERYQTYLNPHMTESLDGPWIGIDGNEVIMANSDGTERKKMGFAEWE